MIAVLVAGILLAWVSFIYLPAEVAIHFGPEGIPDSWATKEFQVLFFLAIHLGMFLLFLFMPSLILTLPQKLVSLPNRDYWLAKENRPRFKIIFENLWWEYGAALLLFLLLTEALTIDANLSSPVQLNNSVFWFLFIAFMAYTVYWVVRICRAFSVPRSVSEH
jgi:uncharacterized membrane protein